MIAPLAIGAGALALGAFYYFGKKKLNPDQQMVYDTAMTDPTIDPTKIMKLANVFHNSGFPDHAAGLAAHAANGLAQKRYRRLTGDAGYRGAVAATTVDQAPVPTTAPTTTTTTTSGSASGSIDLSGGFKIGT